LRKQLNIEAILDLYKYNTEAVLQTTADCRFCFQDTKVISSSKSKQSSKAELIQSDRQYCADKTESLLLLNYVRN